MTTITTPALPLEDRIAEIRHDPHYAASNSLPALLTFVDGGAEGNRLILKSDSTSEAPPPAILRMIGQISRSGHAIRPHGTYNPAERRNKENVTKAKLRFNINASKDSRFPDSFNDHSAFVDNLKKIHDSNVSSAKSPTILRPIADNKDVTFLHQLVIPRPDEDDDDANEEADSEDDEEDGNPTDDAATVASEATVPDVFSFEGWPVDGEWRKELDTFKDTHDILPMQAFTTTGKLIHPFDYMKKLPGAIVDLTFTLIHYNFVSKKKGESGTSRMCIHLDELHVLVPPVMLPGSSPVKKKGVKRTNTKMNAHDGSPTKKRRV